MLSLKNERKENMESNMHFFFNLVGNKIERKWIDAIDFQK